MSKILLVCAHPDDEILGVGGTVARLVRDGHEIVVGFLITRDMMQQIESARAVLGYKGIAFAQYQDQRLDMVPLLEVTQWVERLLSDFPAEIVYTHHNGDLNLDHRIVSQAVLTATRPQGRCTVKEVYAFETPSSTEWGFGQIQPVFQPNVFVDVDDVWSEKIKAWQCYSGEMREIPHPRAITRLAGRAEYWGAISGLKTAEAFQLVRSVR